MRGRNPSRPFWSDPTAALSRVSPSSSKIPVESQGSARSEPKFQCLLTLSRTISPYIIATESSAPTLVSSTSDMVDGIAARACLNPGIATSV